MIKFIFVSLFCTSHVGCAHVDTTERSRTLHKIKTQCHDGWRNENEIIRAVSTCAKRKQRNVDRDESGENLFRSRFQWGCSGELSSAYVIKARRSQSDNAALNVIQGIESAQRLVN